MQREVLPRDCESAGLLRDRPVNVCPAPRHTYCGSAHLGLCRLAPMDEEISLCPKIRTTPSTPSHREHRGRRRDSLKRLPPQPAPPRSSPRLLPTGCRAARSRRQAPSRQPPAAKAEDAEEEGVKFVDLGIDGRVLAALQDVGYEKPSPIQAATIPLLLEGRDVVGLAQTGTGKTAAFAVPALSRLAELHDLNGPSRKTQALVLAPTRELALQVAEAFTSYAKHIDDFTVLPVYGGSAYGPQLAGLRRGAQVVVGTPGRVIDHIAKGSLDLSELQYLVLDEADEMLRMGFAEDVEQIFQQTPADRQVALFSATMPSQIRRMSKQYLNNPAEVTVKSKTTTGANTRQRYLQVMGPHKLDALTRILEVEEFDGVIAFVRTKMATEDLADKLQRPRLPGCRHQRRHPAAAA